MTHVDKKTYTQQFINGLIREVIKKTRNIAFRKWIHKKVAIGEQMH